MVKKVVPMVHVRDVRSTVEWYEALGFTVEMTHQEDEGEMLGALLSFGNSELMFNEGGHPTSAHRREVDLYVHVDDVDELYRRLKDRVEVEAELYDAVYGMCEFIIRDLNRFWITFGQAIGDRSG